MLIRRAVLVMLAAAVAASAQIERRDSPLTAAVKEGDVARVREMISPKLRDGDRCPDGEAIAAYAAARGDIAMLSMLFEAGAAASESGCPDSSPLYEAAQQGHAEAVRLLVSKKADVRFRVGNGSTPLLAALDGPLFEVGPKGDPQATAKLLLEAGSEQDAENKFGHTPLLAAVRKADARLVRLLLDHRADPKRANAKGVSPLALARNEKLDFIAALLEGKRPRKPSPSESALLEAVKAGDEKAVGKLIAGKVDVDAADEGGSTPLIHAAYLGKEAIGLALVKKGADPLIRNARNDTALIYAGARGCAALAAALLERGADPRGKDYYGASALTYAVREGMADAVRVLLAHGADPDEKDKDGVTLLMEAGAKGDEEAVRALLQAKAAANAVNKDGRTALMLASAEGKAGAVRALLDGGADIEGKDTDGMTAFHHAVQHRHDDIAAMLSAKGAKPDQAALVAALRNSDIEIVRSLLKQGVSPAPTPGGDVPLVIAAGAYTNRAAMTSILLNAGAKPDVADADGTTPLMAAAQWSGPESVAAVKLLLGKGADWNARDKKGLTAWTHAMLNGSNDTAGALVEAGAAPEYESLGWDGLFSDIKRSTVGVMDQGSFDELWKKLHKDPQAPVIEFKSYAVVGVFLGALAGPDTARVVFGGPRLLGKTLLVDYAVHPSVVYDAPSTSPYAVKVIKRAGAERIELKAPPAEPERANRFPAVPGE